MWIIFVTICIFLIIALGMYIALYVDKKHEDNDLLRIVEQNGLFYIQKHKMECDDYGKYHSIWEYEGNFDDNGYYRYSFTDYSEAKKFTENLRISYHMDKTKSVKEYFEGKRDDFQIIKYFD